MSNETASGTRGWAIATLILSALYLPLTGFGLSQLPSSPINATGQGPILMISAIAQVLVALAFLIGSIGVIKGKEWGKALLTHASAAALVTIVVGVVIQFMIKDNPEYLRAIVDQIREKAPQVRTMALEDVTKMAEMNLRIGFYGGMVMGAIQAVYCVLLYRHMSSAPMTPVPVPADR